MSDPKTDAPIMMTLAAISYQADIRGQLANTTYATAGDWDLTWGPVDDPHGNLAYVAQSRSTQRYALTIRGSETDFSWDTFYNWVGNLEVTVQSAWPYFGGAGDCMVSYGTWWQASDLCAATYNNVPLGTYLKNLPLAATLMITGHSLGGNLATALASWVSSIRGPQPGQPDPNTVVYTFAAPTAGNADFASAFDARFPSSWRYWNSLDAVPHGWASILDIIDIYDDIGISAPLDVRVAIHAAQVLLSGSEQYYDSYYTQPNGEGTKLAGSAAPCIKPTDPSAWTSEVGAQHRTSTYLTLLGAPIVQAGSAPSATDSEAAIASTFYLPKPPRLSRADLPPILPHFGSGPAGMPPAPRGR